MPRSSEILRPGACLYAFHSGVGTLRRGNSRRRVHMIDRDGKRGSVIIRVIFHHLRQAQFLTHRRTHRHADEPFRIGCHEIHVVFRGKLRRADQIPLIFSVRIVRNDDDFAVAQILYYFLYRVELKHPSSSFFPMRRPLHAAPSFFADL